LWVLARQRGAVLFGQPVLRFPSVVAGANALPLRGFHAIICIIFGHCGLKFTC
jgi:hypothetical protein